MRKFNQEIKIVKLLGYFVGVKCLWIFGFEIKWIHLELKVVRRKEIRIKIYLVLYIWYEYFKIVFMG